MADSTIRCLRELTVGVSPHTIALDPLPYKTNIQWTRISARCLSSKADYIELVLLGGGNYFVIKSQNMASKYDSVDFSGSLLASGEFRVGARFVDLGAGDLIEICAFGVVQTE